MADKQMKGGHHVYARRSRTSLDVTILAARVGMSRSIFAMRFKEKVGTTPMEYLTRWRMLLDRLTNSDDFVYVIALSLEARNPKVLSVKPSERSWLFSAAV